ncbi:hypothetical protein DIPPA_30819 [Diplonema papillatum]|nr:hypothetical protein DIPPA_30819 [Diplonema papillatum]KAJ9447173.1 hypothetical protein DIPPA_30819 [Diplonema papillatum]
MPSGHRWLFYKRPEHHGKRKPTDRHWEKAEVLLEGTTTAEAHLTVRPARPRRWRRGGREATIPLRDLHGMGRSLLDRDEALAFEGQDRRAGVEFRYGNIAWFVRGPPHVKNPKVERHQSVCTSHGIVGNTNPPPGMDLRGARRRNRRELA